MANILKIFKTVWILTRKIPDFTNSTTSASHPPPPFEPLFIFKLPSRHYNIRQNKPQTVFVFFSTIHPVSCDGGVDASSCSPVCLDYYFNALKSSKLALTMSAKASIFVAEMHEQTDTHGPPQSSHLRVFCAQKHGSCSSESPPDSSLSSIRVTRLLWEEGGDNAHTDSG